ncbi:MAG TPA: glycosyl hydrolase family 28 protein [Acidobacteriaceae bacterium]|nr:glycosyl hydrolase family 28 protein [Acidobacteriaceae bacterium]
MLAQDTRVVLEPTIPAVCRTLKARYSSANLDIADHACAKNADACDTARIQQAIDSCSAAAVKANTRLAVALEPDAAYDAFLIQPIRIKTGVTLLVRRGATAYASINPRDYDTSPGRCGTIDKRGGGCHPLIAIDNASNAGLMGRGAIDGRGYHRLLNGAQSWWQIARAADSPGLKQNCPRLIIANHADGLTLYRITLRNSPNFHVAVNHTDGFTAWGVIIDTPKSARNTDGIDPGASRNITITHSFIRTGDDNVAIKGGVSDITVSHDYFYDGHGMSIGSGATPPVTKVFVSDLSLQNTANGIRIKSNIARGGLVDGAVYENICMKNVQVPIAIDPFYNETPIDPFTNPDVSGDRIPIDKNIVLRNIHSVTAQPIIIAGWDSAHAVGITLDGVSIDGIQPNEVHLQFDEIRVGPRGANFTLRGRGVVVEGNEPSQVKVSSCEGRFPPFPEPHQESQ